MRRKTRLVTNEKPQLTALRSFIAFLRTTAPQSPALVLQDAPGLIWPQVQVAPAPAACAWEIHPYVNRPQDQQLAMEDNCMKTINAGEAPSTETAMPYNQAAAALEGNRILSENISIEGFMRAAWS